MIFEYKLFAYFWRRCKFYVKIWKKLFPQFAFRTTQKGYGQKVNN